MTPAQREALGQTYYAAHCLALAKVGWNQPTWDALSEEMREAIRCGVEAAATIYASEMMPTEPPTRPDVPRKLTPSPGTLRAVTAALDEGREAAGLTMAEHGRAFMAENAELMQRLADGAKEPKT